MGTAENCIVAHASSLLRTHTASIDSFVVAKTKTEQPDQVHELRIPDSPEQQGEQQEKKTVAQESPFLISETVTNEESDGPLKWSNHTGRLTHALTSVNFLSVCLKIQRS